MQRRATGRLGRWGGQRPHVWATAWAQPAELWFPYLLFFCLKILIQNLCKSMHFVCFSMPQEAPGMAARLGAASGHVICMFSAFWVFFALAPNTYENAYTFQACVRLATFCTRFLRIFYFSNSGFLWFGYLLYAFWQLALKTNENAYTFQGRMAPATATYLSLWFLSMV